jgi:hypothetical protein
MGRDERFQSMPGPQQEPVVTGNFKYGRNRGLHRVRHETDRLVQQQGKIRARQRSLTERRHDRMPPRGIVRPAIHPNGRQ